jgi:hypothetical protein
MVSARYGPPHWLSKNEKPEQRWMLCRVSTTGWTFGRKVGSSDNHWMDEWTKGPRNW